MPATPDPRPLLALLDDATGGATLIDWSARLARALHCDLELVYLESTDALRAAALPQTQVLAHIGAQWAPFGPPDVERGFRAQQARLRDLAGRIAPRHAVAWQLRSVRGAMPQAAFELSGAAELLFVGAPAPLGPPAMQAPAPARARALRVASLSAQGDAAAAARCRAAAARLAQALSASLLEWRIDPERGPAEPPPAADILVLPRALASAPRLTRWARPVLLVA